MEDQDPEDEIPIMVLHRSRKAYIIEYGCGLALLIFLGVFYFQSIPLNAIVRNVVLVLAVISLITPELSRLFIVYEITHSKVTITKGIFQQTRKNVHFIPLGYIPEINMKQDRIQRLLKYGTIFVHGSAQNSFEIKDVDQPKKILKLIEELIEKNRLGRDGEDDRKN